MFLSCMVFVYGEEVQTQLPWGATYSYIQFTCYGEFNRYMYHYMYLSSEEDSIGVNNLRYHKVYYKRQSPSNIEKGTPCYAIRQEGDKVYVLGDPWDNISDNPGGAPDIPMFQDYYYNYNEEDICNGEYLLYDFGLNVGDTIPHNIMYSRINEIKETSNSNINYRLFINDFYNDDFLSGIGKTKIWFFKPITPYCTCICDEMDLKMELNGVVSKEGNLLYISNTPDYTDPLISRFNSVGSQRDDAGEITIAQSLAKQLLVSFPVLNQRSQLNIYDMQGQLRLSEGIQTAESSIVLDIEKLQEGSYILQMNLNNKWVSKQFIIK